MEALRSIYGIIQAAMLWYNFYTERLSKMGFVINPYDRCIPNKMIDGKQCTIAWHVDDNKVSHVSKEVVHEIMEMLEKHFGKFTKTEGKKHEYLGINI